MVTQQELKYSSGKLQRPGYERNQLYKITFVGSSTGTDGLINYYSIRSMTNSGLGLFAPRNSSGNVVLEYMPVKENANVLNPDLRWIISKEGDHYLFHNGSEKNTNYLVAPGNNTNGSQIVTSASSTRNKWTLEKYTGYINEAGFSRFTSSIDEGKTFDFDGYMISSVSGYNGPVSYEVKSSDGNSNTDKATINATTGEMTALKPGTVQVRIKSPFLDKIWFGLVAIKSKSAYSVGGEFHSGQDVIDASNNWKQCGYNSKYNIDPKLSDLCQDNLKSGIVYFSTHGKQHYISLLNEVYLSDGLEPLSSSSSFTSINKFDLSSAKLYVYDACLTASNIDGSGQNLCTQTIAAGAECVIGWQQKIYSSDARAWQAKFQSKLVSGSTVKQAADYANTFSYNENASIKSWIIYGNSSLVIYDAASAGTQSIYSAGSTSENNIVETNIQIQSLDEIDDLVAPYIKDYSYKKTVAYTNLEQSNYVVDFILTTNGFSTDYGLSVIVENHEIKQIANRIPYSDSNLFSNTLSPAVDNDIVNDALQEACSEISQKDDFSKIVSQDYDLYYEVSTNRYYCRVMTAYQTQAETYGADITLHEISN